MFLIEQLKYKDILDLEEVIIPGKKITCIVGESGSGKTTLIRLLNKLITPDEGNIYYQGKSLKEISSIQLRREVVMLPQSPAIFSGNIADNLLIGLKLSEKPQVSNEVLLKTLEMVKLNKKLDEATDKLSGGEKQRLALGRVLLMNPNVFLLDEPSSALDEETEEIIIKQIVDYCNKNNKTLIIVTHSKKIANTFADLIIQLKDGKVINQ